MKSVKQQQEFDLEVKSFLSFCFKNVLKTNNFAPIHHLRPENYPGGFDIKAQRTIDDEDISVFKRDVDGSRVFIIKLLNHILVVNVQANGHHYGTEFRSVEKTTTSDWAECMYRLISYINYVKSQHGIRDTYMVYNGEGYKLKPVTTIGLHKEYPKLMEILLNIP